MYLGYMLHFKKKNTGIRYRSVNFTQRGGWTTWIHADVNFNITFMFMPPTIIGIKVGVRSTFNNIVDISWRSVLLFEENGVSGENHRPAESP